MGRPKGHQEATMYTIEITKGQIVACVNGAGAIFKDIGLVTRELGRMYDIHRRISHVE